MDVPDKVLLDLRKLTPSFLKAMSFKFKRTLTSLSDILKKLPQNFYRRYGKVGYKYLDADGRSHTYVGDIQYLTDPGYREKVDNRGIISQYWITAKKSDGKKIDVGNLVKSVESQFNLKGFQKSDVRGYLKRLKSASVGSKINYKKIQASIFSNIKDGISDELIQRQIDEGIRIGVLEDNKKTLKGKYCIMTTTSAEDPDESHLNMERVRMRCEVTMKHLSRFGCQHDFEVVE